MKLVQSVSCARPCRMHIASHQIPMRSASAISRGNRSLRFATVSNRRAGRGFAAVIVCAHEAVNERYGDLSTAIVPSARAPGKVSNIRQTVAVRLR
jgi:hypothetical protein